MVIRIVTDSTADIPLGQAQTLVLQSHLGGSSRGEEESLRRQ